MEMFIYNIILVSSVIVVVRVFVVFGFYKFICLGIELSYMYIGFKYWFRWIMKKSLVFYVD